MRRQFVILLGMLVTGCNLFGETRPPKDGDRLDSGAGWDLAGERDIGTTRDTGEPSDVRPPPVDGCLPPSDAELCADFGFDCGALIALVPDGVVERHDALDVGTDTASCGDTEYLDVCSGGSGPTVTFDAAVDGDYVVRAHLWASQASSGTFLSRLRLSQDGSTVHEFAVAATASGLATYEVLLPLASGVHTFQWNLANDYFDSSIPEDRNLYFDWVEVAGPMGPPVDECGLVRQGVLCGGCAASETCGGERLGACSCSCTNMDGSCAAEGPQAGNSCAICVTGMGWTLGDGASCDDGDPCTNDACDGARGVCTNPPVSCPATNCESAACVGGSCQTSTLPDNSACGNGGVCTAGVCACPDGTNLERQCMDGVDEDCDGLTDCADPDCDARNCGAGKSCVMGVCQ